MAFLGAFSLLDPRAAIAGPSGASLVPQEGFEEPPIVTIPPSSSDSPAASDSNGALEGSPVAAAEASIRSREGARMYYFHLHKAGGTTMCNMALKNGMKANLAHNCNLVLFVCKKPDESARTPESQQRLLDSSPWNFVANECVAPHELLPASPSVAFVTTLRDPLQRAESHFYFDQRLFASAGIVPSGISFEEFVLTRLNASDASEYWSYYWKNFATRFFSGEASAAELTPAHLELAKKQVARCSVILDMEHFAESMLLMHDKFGWENLIPLESNKGGSGAAAPLGSKAALLLRSLNEYDLDLYEHMRGLAAQQRASLAASVANTTLANSSLGVGRFTRDSGGWNSSSLWQWASGRTAAEIADAIFAADDAM